MKEKKTIEISHGITSFFHRNGESRDSASAIVPYIVRKASEHEERTLNLSRYAQSSNAAQKPVRDNY